MSVHPTNVFKSFDFPIIILFRHFTLFWMCTQQPQDSSERSAVIVHYNPSSLAHLDSPFGILHWEKHKTKPQSSTNLSPSVYPTQTSATGAKGVDEALWQGISADDSKAQGQGRVAGEGTDCSCGPIRAAQGKSLNTGSSSAHTGAGISCRHRAFPTSLGFHKPSWEPCHGSPRQEQNQSKEKQCAKKEMGALRSKLGLRLRRWKKNAKLVC